MKNKKFFLATLSTIVSCCAFHVMADEISATQVKQWDCGQNCQATLYSDGLFTIAPIDTTQEAQMDNYGHKRDLLQTNPDVYTNFYTTAPWNDDEGHFEAIQKVVVSEGVKNIGDCAFYVDSCERQRSHITEVVFPQGLEKIGYDSFGSTNITSVTIPNGVETLDHFAFARSAIENLVIPDSVETIGSYAFRNCDNLKSVLIGDNINSIGLNAFIQTSAYVYCQEGEGHGGKSCAELVSNTALAPGKLKIYTIENGKIKVGSKTYNSFDELPQYTLRRIYTIDEANAAAGDKNRISIRYR